MPATTTAQGSRKLKTALLAVALLAGGHVLARAQGVSTDIEVAGLLDEIEAGSAKQQRLDREHADLAARKTDLQRDLRSHVRALYRITRPGLSPLAGGVDAVLRHVARVKRLRKVVESEADRLRAIDTRFGSVRIERGSVERDLTAARSRLAALQSGSAGLGDDLSGVLAADGAQYRPPSESGMYGLRLVDPPAATSFESERGRLASPVTGDVRIVASQRAEGEGPGLEFQAPVGTPVRAVAQGRIAFSDRYGSYGRLVIVDHGEGYYSVYGGLGAVEVRVGDDISRSARIGSVGTDFSPSALFFEVRKGTRALEPRAWLGL
jgi:septal ring factor EnvC (AmiA/AmiB activator)